MPQALAAGVVALGSAAGVTVPSGVASVIGSIGAIGLSTGLSVLAGALAGKPETPDPANGQIETQQQVPPRTFVYGRYETSGAIALKKKVPNEETPSLVKIIMVHDGELDAWETIWGDDRVCRLDENGYVDNGPFTQNDESRLQVFLHNGTDDQVADPTVLAKLPDLWTADHRLRGIAYAVIVPHGLDSTNYLQAYPHGEPNFKFTIRGRRLWDPRDSNQDPDVPASWIWTDNAALAILDWAAMHPKGYRSVGVMQSMLDIPSFIDMAELCDELVPLAYPPGSGNVTGSERRYRIATQVDLKNELRKDVMARLRAACDGHLYKTGSGTWALRGGRWNGPSVTLKAYDTDSNNGHIIEAEMRDGVDALSRFNETAITFLSPNNHYGQGECDPWQRVDDPEFLEGKVRTVSRDWTQVPSHGQARRLEKIMAEKLNPDWVGTLRTNFYGLNAIGEETATLSWSEPEEAGDVDGDYWLDPADVTMLEDGTGMHFAVRSAVSTSFDWDPATEEGAYPKVLPPSDIDFIEGEPPEDPVDFAVVAASRAAVLSFTYDAGDGDNPIYIGRFWRSSGISGATFDDAIEVSGPRYRQHKVDSGLLEWTDTAPEGEYEYWLTVENANGDRGAPIGPLLASITYDDEFFLTDDFGNMLADTSGDLITAEV